MDASFKHPIRQGNISRGLLAAVAVALLPLAALAADAVNYTPDYRDHDDHHGIHDSALVEKVRNYAKKFANPDSLLKEPGWIVGTGCVSGPDTGAMGVHIVNIGLTKDGVLDPEQPEAFIYEPQRNGGTVLVGVEFIQDAADWATRNPPPAGPPTLDGHQMNLVGAPNRYGLPAFFELHVWAFEENPRGAFADFNTHVTCEKQPLRFELK
jgi:hypothetical protein